MNNGAIIIFGATGDLSTRKLIPALYTLWAQKILHNVQFIGAARETISMQEIFAKAKPHIEHIDQAAWELFSKQWQYISVDVNNEQDYKKLAQVLNAGPRLVYCALPEALFCTVTDNIAKSGILLRQTNRDDHWHRIVYEKPFGHDAASAQQINDCIAKYLNEFQVFRIDHFLSKELVSNIALVRFTNAIFEPLWNNRYIDQVQIIIDETLGIEGRGAYYDNYGAIADVVQNHLLELLALVAMEMPKKLSGDYIREVREQVLAQVEFVDGMCGQYTGYTKELDVQKNSKTETFAALMMRIHNPRWAGVPWYLKTGKKLNKKETSIHIKFKAVDCLLMRHCPIPSNWLTITIASVKKDDALPEARFTIFANAKKPGVSDELVSMPLDFCHSCVFGPQPGGYEQLLQEIIKGDQSVAVGVGEIQQAWRIVDDIKKAQLPLYIYEPGTHGPEELHNFEKKHGMRWRS